MGAQQRDIQDDGPRWLRDFDSVGSRIEVEINHLIDFSASFRADLERGFESHYQVVRATAASATQPVLAAVEVQQARALLARRLTECVQGLADHVAAGVWLAEVANELAKRYAGADAFSAAKVEDVAAQIPPKHDRATEVRVM
jgi:hypothetical protein